jgi:hypothetical protein
MSVENPQEKEWQGLKDQYLKQIEDVLVESGQPNVDGIVTDVRGHLDRRFAELLPSQRTWENFQKIITEMGPPSDYAELAGRMPKTATKNVSVRYVVVLAIILTAVTAGLFLLPVLLPEFSAPGLTDEMKRAFPPKQQPDNEQKISLSVEAAKSWLQLVDEGAYGQSWSQAAEYFRKNVSEEQWKTAIDGVRKPLGKVLSRKVINSTYATMLPGAPDGQYVVIQFETSFENKASAVETVTPMMDSDGKWHVSGYYIK